jgi:hypothetical protein
VRGKSEDLSVGALGRPESRLGAVHHGARARSGAYTLVSLRGRALGALLLVNIFVSACGTPGTDSVANSEHSCPSRFATTVESFVAGPGPTFGQAKLPEVVLGPPKGAGARNGSFDVVTLGNGGTLTLGFGPSWIVDRPGPDFIVFENPFYVNGDPTLPYAELASVEVSDDGEHFEAFPCTVTEAPYESCAGFHPVYANPDQNAIDATDPALAGGDAFDLADLGVSRARYVRITDRADLSDSNGTFDLDAVAIVNADCP